MTGLSTRQAAKKLGTTQATLSRYIAAQKIPAPKTIILGQFRVHVWSERDIERVRQLLPKIANGRKTRYKKQAAKPKKQSTQPKAAVPDGQSKLSKHSKPKKKSKP